MVPQILGNPHLALKVLSLRLRAPNYEEFSTLNPRVLGSRLTGDIRF